MHVFDQVVALKGSVEAARRNDRQLALEIDKTFKDAARFSECVPGANRILDCLNPPLTFAIVAEHRGLQDRRRPQRGERGASAFLGIHGRERRRFNAETMYELLFNEAVLKDVESAGVWSDVAQGREQRKRVRRNILELVRHDVDTLRKCL